MNILDQLAEYSRLRVAEDKKKVSLEEMKNIAIQMKNEKLCDFAFEKHSKGWLELHMRVQEGFTVKGAYRAGFQIS